MAHMLRLPEPDEADDSITQETKLRTWWSLYMIDQWSSAGLNLPRQIHDKKVRLPMPERAFWALRPEQKAEHNVMIRPGLWGYMIILARIFGLIQDFHQQLANGTLDEHHAEAITQELAKSFEQYLDELPADLHFTVDNLKNQASLGLGQAFVALHLGFHHYATLLYFPFLDAQLSQTPNRSIFVARCKAHARSFGDLLEISHKTKNCEAVYLIVAHMTVVSSSALLHTLLFGEDHELLDTRRRLSFNFEILLKLEQYWPGVDLMVSADMSDFD